MGAQRRIDKHGALETLGRRPRVSVAFVPKAAARQRASRLAGLVWFPVSWPTQTAIRRQVSWLAKNASMDLNPRWHFVLQNYPSCVKVFRPALFAYG